MNLRVRLLMGYVYLLLLLLAGAVVALFHVGRLGTGIGQILEENYASVEASVDMREAMRSERAAILAKLANTDAPPDSETASRRFDEALRVASENQTIEGEGAVLERIAVAREDFETRAETLAAADVGEDALRYWAEEFEPAFEELDLAIESLRRENDQAMREAESHAQDLARQAAIAIGTLSVLGLLSVLALARTLRVRIVDRLGDLTAFARAVASGDLERRGDALVDDELGAITESLNTVLDRHQALEARLRGKLAEHRGGIVSLLRTHPRPCAVTGLDGEIIASTLPREREALLVSIEPALRKAAHQLLSRDFVSVEELTTTIRTKEMDRPAKLSALSIGDGGVFGWLAEFDD